jgi:hypothetical protein
MYEATDYETEKAIKDKIIAQYSESDKFNVGS